MKSLYKNLVALSTVTSMIMVALLGIELWRVYQANNLMMRAVFSQHIVKNRVYQPVSSMERFVQRSTLKAEKSIETNALLIIKEIKKTERYL